MPLVTNAAIVTISLAALWGALRLLWTSLRNPLRNVPAPPNPSLLTGNFVEMFNFDAWDYHHQLCARFGPVVRFQGLLGSQQLYVSDPKALHYILVKEYEIYEPIFIQRNLLVFGSGLLATLGDHHHKQRRLMNPAFSTAHMRRMYPVFHRITSELRDTLAAKLVQGPKELDVLDWMSRAALEMSGQAGFGYSFDALREGSVHRFAEAAKSIVPAMFDVAILQRSLHWLARIGPPKFRRLVLDLIPLRKAHRVRDIVDTMHQYSTDIIGEKKRSLANGKYGQDLNERKDVMSLLLAANMEASADDRLPDEDFAGLVTTILFAATDTTSGALARVFSLLAQYPEWQAKLRDELSEAGHDGEELAFEKVMSLPILDAICKETLRLHPPVTFIPRVARKDTVLPLSTPVIGVDGTHMHELVIPRGTNFIISILAANRDPRTWGPDAHVWNPARWAALPQSVQDAHMPGIYSKTMTFIGGQRSCIGLQFSQTEMKTVLSVLVRAFEFSPPSNAADIIWNMAPVQFPSLRSCPDRKPQMPIRLAPVVERDARV